MAFVRENSIACSGHGHNDDLIATMRLFLMQHANLCSPHESTESSVERTFLVEIYRVLEVNVDHSINAQPEQLFRNQMVQRCLATQMSLGYEGEKKHRSLPAKVAWAFLNLRYASLIFAWAFKRPSGVPGAERDIMKPGKLPFGCDFWGTKTKAGPDILRSVIGLVSWSMSLMNYIVDELFSLGNALKDHGKIPGTDVTFLEAQSECPKEVNRVAAEWGLICLQYAKGTVRRCL